MFQSIAFENFRSLKDVKLSNLSHINIVVGRSAAGKTTLLEAVRLLASPNPSTVTSIIFGRGAQFRGMFFKAEEYYSFLSSIFTNYYGMADIDLQGVNEHHQLENVRLRFDLDSSVDVHPKNFGEASPQVQPFSIAPLQVRKYVDGVQSFERQLALDAGGWLDLGGREFTTSNSFFGSNWDLNSEQVAQWYSELSVFNNELEINTEIMRIFPEILSISIQNSGSASVLHAALKGVNRKLPLSIVSSGINKFLSILIAIKRFEGGVVLIDELENGIFYKVLDQMWEAIHRFAIKSRVQLFITTHSLECLKAATTVIDTHSDDFSLLQTQHTSEGSRYFQSSGRSAAAAIESGLEVRR